MAEAQIRDNAVEVLASLFDKDLAGWKLVTVYWAERVHGLSGNFPLVYNDGTDVPVITLNREFLEKAVAVVQDRPYKLVEFVALLSPEGDKIFVISHLDVNELEIREVTKVLTVDDFKELIANEERPFKWAFGLVG